MNCFDKPPIFIIGCTNTGTKCLLHTLMQHRDLGGFHEELHFYGIQGNVEGRLNRLFSLYPCFKTNYAYSTKTARVLEHGIMDAENFRAYLDFIAKTTNDDKIDRAERMLIKSPKLSLRIGWLKECFPSCHIINIVRNPWSVVEGIRRKLSHMGDVPMNMDTPTAMAQWINTYSIIELDCRGIDNFHTVRYEDMIKADTFPDPEGKNTFWSTLLSRLDLSPDGLTVPNKSAYSNFEKDRDSTSLQNLSQWEKEFIRVAGHGLIQRYGYSLPKE